MPDIADPHSAVNSENRSFAACSDEAVDRLERLDDAVAVPASGVAEAVADQVHDALLHHRLLPRGRDGLRQALEPIADSDQHIFNASVLQLGEY